MLAVEPDVEAAIGLTRIARFTRQPNRALGADGLCLGAQGLKIKHDALLALIMAYAQAWRDKRG